MSNNKHSGTINCIIKTRIRKVNNEDGTTTEVKADKLKAGDFADKAEWKAYSRHLTELCPLLERAAATDDAINPKAKDAAARETARLDARKSALDKMQTIYNYMAHVAGLPTATMQTRDVNYIIRLAYSRRRDKTTGAIGVYVKSPAALQTLLEDVMYYRANKMHTPTVKLSDAVNTRLARYSEADAKAKAPNAAAEKPGKGKTSGKGKSKSKGKGKTGKPAPATVKAPDKTAETPAA